MSGLAYSGFFQGPNLPKLQADPVSALARQYAESRHSPIGRYWPYQISRNSHQLLLVELDSTVLIRCYVGVRSDLNAARSSFENSCGCSQAA
jgi:hypothetical protein